MKYLKVTRPDFGRWFWLVRVKEMNQLWYIGDVVVVANDYCFKIRNLLRLEKQVEQEITKDHFEVMWNLADY